MRKLAVVCALASALAVPAVAQGGIHAGGRVKLAIVGNSYYDATNGQGFQPTHWQIYNCTAAYTSSVRWNWAAWIYTGGKRKSCLDLLSEPHFPTGIEFMKIEQNYWHNVMAVRPGNPCFEQSASGQPTVPWGVIDDLLNGVDCPSAPGW